MLGEGLVFLGLAPRLHPCCIRFQQQPALDECHAEQQYHSIWLFSRWFRSHRWNCVKTGQTGIRKDAASAGRIGGQKQQPSKQRELQAFTVIETWPNTDLGAIALPWRGKNRWSSGDNRKRNRWIIISKSRWQELQEMETKQQAMVQIPTRYVYSLQMSLAYRYVKT